MADETKSQNVPSREEEPSSDSETNAAAKNGGIFVYKWIDDNRNPGPKPNSNDNDMFTISSSSADETTKTPTNNDTSTDEAYFARSPLAFPITPTSTQASSHMSYSSTSDNTSSFNRSFMTSTTMEYDYETSTSAGTSQGTEVLAFYNGHVGSVASSSCAGSIGAMTSAAVAIEKEGNQAAHIIPPLNYQTYMYSSEGETGNILSTSNFVASNGDIVTDGGEVSVSITSGYPVLKMLEQEDDSLPMFSKEIDKTCASKVCKRRLLLALLLCLILVVSASVGFYITSKSSARMEISADIQAGSSGNVRTPNASEVNVESVPSGKIHTSTKDPVTWSPSLAPTILVEKKRANALPEDTSKGLHHIPSTSSKSSPSSDSSPLPTLVPTFQPTAATSKAPTSMPTPQPQTSPTSMPTTPQPQTSLQPTNVPSTTLDGEFCGEGFRGNGKCSDRRLCCSAFGWCGSGPNYCG